MSPAICLFGLLTVLLLGGVGLCVQAVVADRGRFFHRSLPLALISSLGALTFSAFWVFAPSANEAPPFLNSLMALVRPSTTTSWWALGICLFLFFGILMTSAQVEVEKEKNRLLFLLLVSGIGQVALAVGNHWTVALVAWQVAALPLTLASVGPKHSGDPILGVFFSDFFASILMVLGAVLVFAQFETLDLSSLLEAIVSESQTSDVLLYSGAALLFAGVFSRLSVFPFHLANRNRAESGPLSIAGYASIALPFAAAAFSWNLIGEVFKPTMPQWRDFLGELGLIAVWLGSLTALVRTTFRGFLSSVWTGCAGWTLLALSAPGVLEKASFFFLFTQCLALLSVCYVVVLVYKNQGTENIRWNGLFYAKPLVGFGVFSCLLAITCLPPAAGFSGRTVLLTQMGYLLEPWKILALTLSGVPLAWIGLKGMHKLMTPVTSPFSDWVFEPKAFRWILAAVGVGMWILGLMPFIASPD